MHAGENRIDDIADRGIDFLAVNYFYNCIVGTLFGAFQRFVKTDDVRQTRTYPIPGSGCPDAR
jgi:hypothetical protein